MLYEYWLPHFRDCVVEAHAQSLMASYNGINGTPNNINHWLLTAVLKNQWHHEGFVVSDLGGVNTMVNGHFAKQLDYVDAVAESLMAGCDFSDKEFMENIPAAVRAGKLTEARLNDAVSRVMRVRMRLGEFDPQEDNPYSRISTNVIGSAGHRQLALRAAREAIVLLENKNDFLPLDKTKLKTIAVIGPHADLFTPGGYSGIAKDPVKPLQGIQNRAPETKIVYVAGCRMALAKNAPANEDEELQHAVEAAKQAQLLDQLPVDRGQLGVARQLDAAVVKEQVEQVVVAVHDSGREVVWSVGAQPVSSNVETDDPFGRDAVGRLGRLGAALDAQ